MVSDRYKSIIEVAAVFAVFFLFGAWKVPDVNEAHYICKAIHFWNPHWITGDPFLESKDAHWAFYFVFGWLSFFCSPAAMAWIGRFTAWSLLAWSWQRLSYALLPVRGASIVTALALAYYIESFNMAGEWLIGGIEGKSLAYPFVFFALEAILRNRWNRAGIFLGIACAMHILVGGWTAVIAVGMFVFGRGWKTAFPWIGILTGGCFALCGLIPGLTLDSNTPNEIVRQAHQIYAFDRLQHHLVPYLFKDSFLLRFALLTAIWIILCRQNSDKNQRILNSFIWGTLGLSAIGMITAYCLMGNRELSAEILRFYWFRLSDIALPLGVAIGSVQFCLMQWNKIHSVSIPSFMQAGSFAAIIAVIYVAVDYLCFNYGKFTPDTNVPWLITLIACLGLFFMFRKIWALSSASFLLFYVVIALAAPLTVVPKYVHLRTYSALSRSEPVGPSGQRLTAEWHELCQWIKKNTPHTAKFWVPRDAHTFKWYAHRSDIGTWKNIPQDADSVVKWFEAMDELYHYKDKEGITVTDRLLTTLLNAKTEAELSVMQQKYGFDYIVCVQSYEMPSHATLELVYANEVFYLYRVLERTKN